uniref:hypothetical protein n=1 Tax=Candidatus Electrothrix sp. TaxID=2170559 RepID=UPI0040568E0D
MLAEDTVRTRAGDTVDNPVVEDIDRIQVEGTVGIQVEAAGSDQEEDNTLLPVVVDTVDSLPEWDVVELEEAECNRPEWDFAQEDTVHIPEEAAGSDREEDHTLLPLVVDTVGSLPE